MQLEVTLEEVMKGSTVPFRIHRKKYHGSKTCTGCNGQGQRIQQMSLGIGIMTQSVVECTSCQGSGSLYSEKDITTSEEIIQVPVPQGIPMGNKLVIRGKADEYPGRDTGDVVLSVVYKKHVFYRPSTKNPLDLEASIPLSLSEFLLGFEKHVLLLDQTTLAIHQPTHTPLRRILSGPVEKVIPKHGFSYKGHTGSLVLRFEVHFPDPLPLEALSAFPALTNTNPFLPSIGGRGGTADHPTVHLDRC
jgi:DnaJ family protein A protein 2